MNKEEGEEEVGSKLEPFFPNSKLSFINTRRGEGKVGDLTT